jgi:hypothetical protein
MLSAVLSPPPVHLPTPLAYETCWDGPITLYPLDRLAVAVAAAAIVLAAMWFTPGPMSRRERLGEIGLFAAAGLAWGLMWVALPALLVILGITWDTLVNNASNASVALSIVLPIVPVAALMLSAMILRVKPMRAHFATVRGRWTSVRRFVFVTCCALYGMWLPIAVIAAIVSDYNASGDTCDHPNW